MSGHPIMAGDPDGSRLRDRVHATWLACEGLAGDLADPSTCDLESCLYRAERVVADLREVLAMIRKKGAAS